MNLPIEKGGSSASMRAMYIFFFFFLIPVTAEVYHGDSRTEILAGG